MIIGYLNQHVANQLEELNNSMKLIVYQLSSINGTIYNGLANMQNVKIINNVIDAGKLRNCIFYDYMSRTYKLNPSNIKNLLK